jgi:predicted transcriptional regulator
MIVSVPEELDDDHMRVLDLAQDDNYGSYGRVTTEQMQTILEWDDERCQRALQKLMGKGMVWFDINNEGEKMYWFPSLWSKEITSSNNLS